jgi:high-affinity nickel permease
METKSIYSNEQIKSNIEDLLKDIDARLHQIVGNVIETDISDVLPVLFALLNVFSKIGTDKIKNFIKTLKCSEAIDETYKEEIVSFINDAKNKQISFIYNHFDNIEKELSSVH